MANPYDIWDTRKFLGVFEDVKPTYSYWRNQFYTTQHTSANEWIDFEKLSAHLRVMAPFVRPLATGKPVYQNSASGFRFRPAYIKTKDVIDPLAPLTKRPGLERSMLNDSTITPMQRRELIRLAMVTQQIAAIERRWEWMAAKGIIDAGYVVEGEEYPAVELDFLRDPNLTVVKTSGSYWGDTGVSIVDDIQEWIDTMFEVQFGGFPNRLTIGSKVWSVMRKDEEFLKHLDTTVKGGNITYERGLIGADRVVKVGEMSVGGGSGATIEIYLYRDTFVNDQGVEELYLQPNELVFTSSPDRINGIQCFGAIIDPYANYQSLPIFARNYMTHDDPVLEWMLQQSAPLMVPINPNATMKATVVAL